MLQIAEFSSCSEINGIIFICIYHISFLSSHGNATAAKSLQTLCDPIDCLLPGSSVPGTLQARTLEWVAISFFNSWKWKLKVKLLSLVRLFTVPWTAAYQAPPSMEFSRQVYWSGLPFPSLSLGSMGILTVLFFSNTWTKWKGNLLNGRSYM